MGGGGGGGVSKHLGIYFQSLGNLHHCLKTGEEKAKQNNRPILVISVSGESAQKDTKDIFCFSKSKFGVKSQSSTFSVWPLGTFILMDPWGPVANLTVFLFSLLNRVENKADETSQFKS